MTSDRPQQIHHEHVYGNFRQRSPRKRKNSDWRKQRPGMDEDHLQLIRKLPCTVCPIYPAGTAHHLKATGTNERGTGVRSTDRWAVPLCVEHHDEIERQGTRNELAWFKSHGIDALDLATALWINTGDLGQMIKVLMAHRGK